MGSASYSVPSASCQEGAHLSARPWVPGAKAMIGRWPARGVVGLSTVPVTAMALPVRSVVRYMIRCTLALTLIALSGSR